MKRLNGMAALIIAALVAVFTTACGSGATETNGAKTENKKIENAKTETEKAAPPSDKGDRIVTGGDLAFINDAAPGGMAEVELGKLALQKGKNPEVKAFAERMIADHSKAGEELMNLATLKKVMPPKELNPSQKELIDKLSKLSGDDFDREYVKAMVIAHDKDVAAFDAVSKTAVDKDVKDFATKTLPTLKEHQQMIKALGTKMKIV